MSRSLRLYSISPFVALNFPFRFGFSSDSDRGEKLFLEIFLLFIERKTFSARLPAFSAAQGRSKGIMNFHVLFEMSNEVELLVQEEDRQSSNADE